MVQTAQIALFINSNTTRSIASGHLRDMLHDSKTELIQFTELQSG